MDAAAASPEHKAWKREDFPTPQSYAWARVWYAFLLREAQHDDVDIPADASADEIKQLRMGKQLCVEQVTLHTQTNTATFNGTLRIHVGQKVSLSRVSPDVDCWEHFLTIASPNGGNSVKFQNNTRWPTDASSGHWRLDVHHDNHRTQTLMWHVSTFALNALRGGAF